MRITGSLGSGLDPRRHDGKADAREQPGQTLPAVVRPAHRVEKRIAPRVRPAATLVAQLVAGVEDVPEMRLRRRADPGVGAERYRAMAELGPQAPRAKTKLI